MCYTDFWTFYEEILLTKRHKAVVKESDLSVGLGAQVL